LAKISLLDFFMESYHPTMPLVLLVANVSGYNWYRRYQYQYAINSWFPTKSTQYL